MSKKAIATRRSEAKVAGRRFEEAHGGVSFEEAEAQQAESMRRALAHKVWFGLVWVGVVRPNTLTTVSLLLFAGEVARV